jgi:hypothetical protein
MTKLKQKLKLKIIFFLLSNNFILFHNIQAENQSYKQVNPIRLFQIMSVSILFRLFRVMASEMLGRLLLVFKLLL